MAEPLDRPRGAATVPTAGVEELTGRLLGALAAHGVLDVLVAAVEQSDQLAAIALEAFADESHTHSLRNLLILTQMLAVLPAEQLWAAFAEPVPERVSLADLFRRSRSPAARRGMHRALRILEALGAADAPRGGPDHRNRREEIT